MECAARLVNYLIDEAIDISKGANSIISMLHHFFEVYGFGEENVHLHVDNCGGQNKNNAMVGYLLWHVLTGLHKNVTVLHDHRTHQVLPRLVLRLDEEKV